MSQMFRDMAIDSGYDPDEMAGYFQAMYEEMAHEAWYQEIGWYHELIYRADENLYPLFQQIFNEPILLSP